MVDSETLTSLAGRLATLERGLTEQDRYDVRTLSDGRSLHDLSHALLDAVDPDRQLQAAQEATGVADPAPEAVDAGGGPAHARRRRGCWRRTRAAGQAGRHPPTQRAGDRRVDHRRGVDVGYDPAAVNLAQNTVENFRRYIETHKDEITALQLLYSRPYGQRALTYRDIQELAAMLEQPPYSWTTERLWQAYAQVEQDKVRGVGASGC